MRLPTFESYCDRTTKGNALVFSFGPLDVYYSYRTPVAFRFPTVNGGRVVVRENSWGPTTGKHLNAIDDGDKEAKRARVTSEEFERMLSGVLDSIDAPPAESGTVIVEEGDTVELYHMLRGRGGSGLKDKLLVALDSVKPQYAAELRELAED